MWPETYSCVLKTPTLHLDGTDNGISGQQWNQKHPKAPVSELPSNLFLSKSPKLWVTDAVCSSMKQNGRKYYGELQNRLVYKTSYISIWEWKLHRIWIQHSQCLVIMSGGGEAGKHSANPQCSLFSSQQGLCTSTGSWARNGWSGTLNYTALRLQEKENKERGGGVDSRRQEREDGRNGNISYRLWLFQSVLMELFLIVFYF